MAKALIIRSGWAGHNLHKGADVFADLTQSGGTVVNSVIVIQMCYTLGCGRRQVRYNNLRRRENLFDHASARKLMRCGAGRCGRGRGLMWRMLAVIGGVSGAACLSQYPEFSQQYLQRLAGKVDALTAVVADFDASAARNDLTRDAALLQLTGTAFLTDRQSDMRRNIATHDRLTADLEQLRAATPLMRLTMPQRLGDPETFAAAWADFRPAVPATVDGVVSAGVGYVAGWGLFAALWWLLSWPFRRKVS